MKTVRLEQVPVGADIVKWGRHFTVLGERGDGILVLQNSIEKDIPFADEGREGTVQNNFETSLIHEYLNEVYLRMLRDNGADIDSDLLEQTIDLKCTLGQREYGYCVVKAGLLTLEDYGRYYDLIPAADGPWWLATPCRTPSLTTIAEYAMSVWAVYSKGVFDYEPYSYSYGVRPALNLNPSLLVSYDGNNETENEIDLSEVTTAALVKELAVRFGGAMSEPV